MYADGSEAEPEYDHSTNGVAEVFLRASNATFQTAKPVHNFQFYDIGEPLTDVDPWLDVDFTETAQRVIVVFNKYQAATGNYLGIGYFERRIASSSGMRKLLLANSSGLPGHPRVATDHSGNFYIGSSTSGLEMKYYSGSIGSSIAGPSNVYGGSTGMLGYLGGMDYGENTGWIFSYANIGQSGAFVALYDGSSWSDCEIGDLNYPSSSQWLVPALCASVIETVSVTLTQRESGELAKRVFAETCTRQETHTQAVDHPRVPSRSPCFSVGPESVAEAHSSFPCHRPHAWVDSALDGNAA